MKTLIALAIWLSALSAFSQGRVYFNNAAAPSTGNPLVLCPFYYDGITGPVLGLDLKIDGSRRITGPDGYQYGGVFAMAGLYGGPAGSDPSTLQLLVPAVGFKTGNAAGYLNVGMSGTRLVPDVPPGSPADFIIKVWDFGTAGVLTYEDALIVLRQHGGGYLTESTVIHVAALGGVGIPPSPSANLGELNGQNIRLHWVAVPEPCTIAIGVLGAVAGVLLLRCRKS